MNIIKVHVSQPVNQDTPTILITRHDDDGRQYFARAFVWEEYRTNNVLDVSEISFPSSLIQVTGNLTTGGR